MALAKLSTNQLYTEFSILVEKIKDTEEELKLMPASTVLGRLYMESKLNRLVKKKDKIYKILREREKFHQ